MKRMASAGDRRNLWELTFANGAVDAREAHPRSCAAGVEEDRTCGRLISIASLGLIMIEGHRRCDCLLETMAVHLDASDLTWIE